jgi:GNAT superfamily N-acetyltransferase
MLGRLTLEQLAEEGLMPIAFADRPLAARIERSVVRDLTRYAEVCNRLDPDLGAEICEFAGGIALFLAPGSPVNMIYGAGLTGPASVEAFVAVERFYAEHGTRAAISLSPLADEGFVAQLGVRGWMLTDFENVLVREPADAAGEGTPATDVEVRVASTAEERATWADVSSGAFSAPEPPSPEVVRLGDAMAARDDVTLLIASVDGHAAGAGALWLDDGLGWLLGDATLPQYRRRGAQSALLAERTRLAALAGCELAVTEARPGSTSQRNMERLGYRVVYTRVELIAPPAR